MTAEERQAFKIAKEQEKIAAMEVDDEEPEAVDETFDNFPPETRKQLLKIQKQCKRAGDVLALKENRVKIETFDKVSAEIFSVLQFHVAKSASVDIATFQQRPAQLPAEPVPVAQDAPPLQSRDQSASAKWKIAT